MRPEKLFLSISFHPKIPLSFCISFRSVGRGCSLRPGSTDLQSSCCIDTKYMNEGQGAGSNNNNNNNNNSKVKGICLRCQRSFSLEASSETFLNFCSPTSSGMFYCEAQTPGHSFEEAPMDRPSRPRICLRGSSFAQNLCRTVPPWHHSSHTFLDPLICRIPQQFPMLAVVFIHLHKHFHNAMRPRIFLTLHGTICTGRKSN